MLVFFFSSRRRHTRYWRDWSSDVCSSDLSILLVILTILVVFAANNIYLVALISIIPMTILSMRANLVYTISSLVVLGGLAYIVGGPGQMSLIMLVYLLPSALSGLMYGKELVSKIARYPKIGVYMKGTGKEILSFINIKFRSEERRVGKECRSRWSPYH